MEALFFPKDIMLLNKLLIDTCINASVRLSSMCCVHHGHRARRELASNALMSAHLAQILFSEPMWNRCIEPAKVGNNRGFTATQIAQSSMRPVSVS